MAGRRLMEAVAQADHIATFGTLIAEGPTATVLADPAVRRAYLGDLPTEVQG